MANQSSSEGHASGAPGGPGDRAKTMEADKKRYQHSPDDSQKKSDDLKKSNDLKRGGAGKMFNDRDKATEDGKKAGQPSPGSTSR